MSQNRQLSLQPLTLDTAGGRAKELLEAARAKLGFVPNMYRHMALNPGLLETYMDGYVRFRADPEFTPAEQEVVLLTISRVQSCLYCVAAHSFLADQVAQVPRGVIDAIRDGEPVPDERLGALHDFARRMILSRGKPTSAEIEAFFAAGFEEAHILALILATAVKTISNFSNHISQPELDPMFAGWVWNG